MNRNYFDSIYFRELGNVLFEIATDQPGFTVDEDKNSLGENLKLPSWLENTCTEIENALPEIKNNLWETPNLYTFLTYQNLHL